MAGPFATSPHRAKGSWAPRLAGVGAIVVIAGGVLGVYLSTTHAQHPARPGSRSRPPALSGKVVSVQSVGVIDFGPYDHRDPVRNDTDDHPLMLIQYGTSVDFINVPASELRSGTPQWTADQMSDGSEIFIYVPTGKCLSPDGAQLQLTRCNLGLAQRWRARNSQILLSQAIAQYANAKTGACLTAPVKPGPAKVAPCGKPRTKTQEIAFWWSA
jgi:hypothetical protein